MSHLFDVSKLPTPDTLGRLADARRAEVESTVRRPTDRPTPAASDLAGLPCLSVRQPWASLIVGGRKWAENRTWTTRHRGPLGVHASKSPPPADDLAFCGVSAETAAAAMPCGGLLGVVRVIAVLEMSRIAGVNALEAAVRGPFENAGRPLDDAAFRDGLRFIEEDSPYVWLLDEPVRFDRPVPVPGRTAIWKFPERS